MMVLGLGLGVRPAGSVTSPDPVAPPANILLAEDGSSLLAEDGSNILVES